LIRWLEMCNELRNTYTHTHTHTHTYLGLFLLVSNYFIKKFDASSCLTSRHKKKLDLPKLRKKYVIMESNHSCRALVCAFRFRKDFEYFESRSIRIAARVCAWYRKRKRRRKKRGRAEREKEKKKNCIPLVDINKLTLINLEFETKGDDVSLLSLDVSHYDYYNRDDWGLQQSARYASSSTNFPLSLSLSLSLSLCLCLVLSILLKPEKPQA